MASSCKRMRLSAGDDYDIIDDDDDDDDRVVVVCTEDNAASNKVEVTLTPASHDDDVKRRSVTSKLKSNVVDLTAAAAAAPPRRSFAHTAEVIRARYIKALQQLQRVSALIDAVAAQQVKLEARREHLQTLMKALSTMYRVVREHHRAPPAAAAAAAVPPRGVDVPSHAVDSQVTSSTSTDCCPPVDEPRETAAEGPRDACRYYGGPTDATVVAAHCTRNRVDISPSTLGCPPPAHSAKVDITGCTYIVRNSCHATGNA